MLPMKRASKRSINSFVTGTAAQTTVEQHFGSTVSFINLPLSVRWMDGWKASIKRRERLNKKIWDEIV